MTTRPIQFPLDRRSERTDAAARLERLGADQCDDDELLALLLGTGSTARRTARRMLERFGTLADVMRADPVELRVAGLSQGAALRVSACAELGRRVARAWPPDP